MKPSQVASDLRRIADTLSRSKSPSKTRVASAVKVVLAGLETSGGQDLKIPMQVGGSSSGKSYSGKMTVVVNNGIFGGYDSYLPDPGTFDVTQDEEMLEAVLDECHYRLTQAGITTN